MPAHGETQGSPEDFDRAVRSLLSGSPRPEVIIEEAPAPRRLAPYSAAVNGQVPSPERRELSSGRLVLLHDPDGVEQWEGRFRVVVYVRAGVEADLATEPLLTRVGWSWLTESLERHGAGQVALAGTVTRSASESFGAIVGQAGAAEVEIRASWTPLSANLAPHLAAWCDLLCAAAGLPPLPRGVIAIQRRRRG